MAKQKNAQSDLKYLDMQAYVGITKHNGGFAATDELLSLCHIEEAREALNVGCGIGVGSAYIAKKHNCRVVGVDISEKMLAWSRLRAREERVEDKVEFRLADVLDLPFEADRFDVVFCESVIAFVDDKRRAIQELIRVTRPGGYVGLNEPLWFKEPSPEMVARVRASTGADIPLAATWQALWEESRLRDRVVRLYPNGNSTYITEGNLRASHRSLSEPPFDNVGLPYHTYFESNLEPIPAGQPVELVFDLLPTAYQFPKGNRMRVTITFADSDSFETPRLDPAPQLRLLRTSNHPSFIEIPFDATTHTLSSPKIARMADAPVHWLCYTV